MTSGSTRATTSSSPAELRKLFQQLYRQPCRIYCAPGRINLIGEHTDYNDGFVMPAAIEFHCSAAIAITSDRTFEVHSTKFQQSRSFHLDHPQREGDCKRQKIYNVNGDRRS